MLKQTSMQTSVRLTVTEIDNVLTCVSNVALGRSFQLTESYAESPIVSKGAEFLAAWKKYTNKMTVGSTIKVLNDDFSIPFGCQNCSEVVAKRLSFTRRLNKTNEAARRLLT
jgi:hypothetical protein